MDTEELLRPFQLEPQVQELFKTAHVVTSKWLIDSISCYALCTDTANCSTSSSATHKILTWDGKLKNVRPITLLEVGDKLMKGILADRLQDMLVKQGALKGQNSGFLKGKTTEDPLFILQGILEDAHQDDNQEVRVANGSKTIN
eukprot:tig00000764_g3991.t1